MKILITGVNGFVGKTLYKSLAREHDVVGIYNTGHASFDNCFKANLTIEEEVRHAFEKTGIESVGTIVHLASQMAGANNVNDLSVLNINSAIAKNMAIMAKKYEIKHFINLSSSSVYPNIDGVYSEESIPNPALNPDCIYGLSKLNSEVILDYFLAKSKTKVTHLRTAIIYGEGMDNSRLIPVIEKEIAEHNSVTLFGNGERLLNLIHVEKLAEYISFFMNHPSANVVNVAEECISVLDLANRIIAEKGNSQTKIILKEEGNRCQFILDTKKLKQIISNN
jgi:nucleoside-diphosphate-sugar epimerase